MDDLLAQHIAHLFIRDPLFIYAENLEQDPDNETDHFEVKSTYLHGTSLVKHLSHLTEYSVYQLAVDEVQASSFSRLSYWMEGGV